MTLLAFSQLEALYSNSTTLFVQGFKSNLVKISLASLTSELFFFNFITYFTSFSSRYVYNSGFQKPLSNLIVVSIPLILYISTIESINSTTPLEQDQFPGLNSHFTISQVREFTAKIGLKQKV
jgi:hypothetical protein